MKCFLQMNHSNYQLALFAVATILLREYITVPNLSSFGTLAILCAGNKWWIFYLTLLFSDVFTGLYDFKLMLLVYLSYTGYMVTKNPIAGSFIFFILSNLAVYFTSNYYQSPAEAIAAGLPFYKYTLIGDVIFYLLYSTGAQLVSDYQKTRLLEEKCDTGDNNLY